MKTIRVTGIALSIAALLLVAIAPPASAQCSSLSGNYAFRLVGGKSFAADLANSAAVGDPANVSGKASAGKPGAGRQNVVVVGTFFAASGSLSGGDALATTDGLATFTGSNPTGWSDTETVEFPFTGSFECGADLTGTLTMVLGLPAAWTCTDTTTSPASSVACTGTEENSNEGCTTGGPPALPYPCCTGSGTGTCNEMTFSMSVSATNGRVELAETDNILPHVNGDTSTTKIFLSGEAIKR